MKAGTKSWQQCADHYGVSRSGLRAACRITERERERRPETRGRPAALNDTEALGSETESQFFLLSQS